MTRHTILPGHGRHVTEHPRSLPGRLLSYGAYVTVGLLAVALVAAAAVYLRLDGNISSQDISGLLGEDRPDAVDAPGDGQPLNVLLVGDDTRAFAGGQAFGDDVTGQRNDTTILLHLAADRGSATMVSIPRDSMVDAPACQIDATGATSPPGRVQFNSTYATGGIACVVRTMESLTNVRIDHFVVVNFAGFEQMVDAVGGVEVCLAEPVRDRQSGLDLPAGRTVVAGQQALAYVRTRSGIGDGSDLQRIERQQAFLSSMVQRVTSSGVLLRPDRLFGLLDAATSSMTTDPELANLNELRKIAQSVQSLPAGGVRFVTVPTVPDPDDENRVVWTPEADALWTALRTDSPIPGIEPPPTPPTPTAPTTATPPLVASPGDIEVRVVNAGAAPGAAGDAREDLELQGFVVTGVFDGDEEDVAGVIVRFAPGGAEQARTAAAAFPGAVAEQDENLSAGVEVLLGDGAPVVAEVSNRLGEEPLPDRAQDAAPPSGGPLEARVATDDICSA